MSKFNFFLLFFIYLLFISCDTSEYINISTLSDRIPIGIANDFEMTYTDSMKIKSLINAPTHKDFSNHAINYSEFENGIKVTLFDDDRTTTITSESGDYAVNNAGTFTPNGGTLKIATDDNTVIKGNEWGNIEIDLDTTLSLIHI